jgi:hypothetical protein
MCRTKFEAQSLTSSGERRLTSSGDAYQDLIKAKDLEKIKGEVASPAALKKSIDTIVWSVSEIAVIRYEKGRPFVGSCREKNHDNPFNVDALKSQRSV